MGRSTKVNYIDGKIIAAARELSMNVLLSRTLLQLGKAVEWEATAPGPIEAREIRYLPTPVTE